MKTISKNNTEDNSYLKHLDFDAKAAESLVDRMKPYMEKYNKLLEKQANEHVNMIKKPTRAEFNKALQKHCDAYLNITFKEKPIDPTIVIDKETGIKYKWVVGELVEL